MEIKQINRLTPALAEAFTRLLPQLSPSLECPSEQTMLSIVENDRTLLLAACQADRIVGVLTLAWYDAPSGRKAWIEDVVVDAEARGCGAGRMLVRKALDLASEVGAAKVMLTSNPSRTAARALYRDMGFEEAQSLFVLKLK